MQNNYNTIFLNIFFEEWKGEYILFNSVRTFMGYLRLGLDGYLMNIFIHERVKQHNMNK